MSLYGLSSLVTTGLRMPLLNGHIWHPRITRSYDWLPYARVTPSPSHPFPKSHCGGRVKTTRVQILLAPMMLPGYPANTHHWPKLLELRGASREAKSHQDHACWDHTASAKSGLPVLGALQRSCGLTRSSSPGCKSSKHDAETLAFQRIWGPM